MLENLLGFIGFVALMIYIFTLANAPATALGKVLGEEPPHFQGSSGAPVRRRGVEKSFGFVGRLAAYIVIGVAFIAWGNSPSTIPPIEKTIVVTAVILWFAQGWYLNTRLRDVHQKLDQILDAFNGLRDYLYEIDPQFDDERELWTEFQKGDSLFAGMHHSELINKKETEGKRTLFTPL